MKTTAQVPNESVKRGLRLSEALWLLLPFVVLQIVYGLLTDLLGFGPPAPHIQMTAAFWIPAFLGILCYGYLIANLYGYRKDQLSWREVTASIVSLFILGLIIWPIYEMSLRGHERSKLHLPRH